LYLFNVLFANIYRGAKSLHDRVAVRAISGIYFSAYSGHATYA
jgi:hypothetical protein